MKSNLKIRYIGNVDKRLRNEMIYFFKWIRHHYTFESVVNIHFINEARLIDFNRGKCHLYWWHSNTGDQPFSGKISVKSFKKNLSNDGAGVAYPTVVCEIGRLLKYYFQSIKDSPQRSDYAELWGDKLLDAYINERIPPKQ